MIERLNDLKTGWLKADLWTPASLFRDPADLGLTDGTHDPVAAGLLNDNHLTRRTLHCISKLQQLLQRNCVHNFSLPINSDRWISDPVSGFGRFPLCGESTSGQIACFMPDWIFTICQCNLSMSDLCWADSLCTAEASQSMTWISLFPGLLHYAG